MGTVNLTFSSNDAAYKLTFKEKNLFFEKKETTVKTFTPPKPGNSNATSSQAAGLDKLGSENPSESGIGQQPGDVIEERKIGVGDISDIDIRQNPTKDAHKIFQIIKGESWEKGIIIGVGDISDIDIREAKPLFETKDVTKFEVLLTFEKIEVVNLANKECQTFSLVENKCYLKTNGCYFSIHTT